METPTMTPRELAEKIWNFLEYIDPPALEHPKTVDWIESLLTEALAEAFALGLEKGQAMPKPGETAYFPLTAAEARAAAYEDAAKIVEADCDWSSGYSVKAASDRAAKIRRRAGDNND